MYEYRYLLLFCLTLGTLIYFYPILLLWSILWCCLIWRLIEKIIIEKKIKNMKLKPDTEKIKDALEIASYYREQRDYTNAIKFYKKAIKYGNTDAIYMINDCYKDICISP